jgi:hypothetical protein
VIDRVIGMDRSKFARRYALVLDPSDPMAAVLIAAIDTYMAIKQSEQRRFSSDNFGSTCPYCAVQFANKTERASRQALSAHIRQIHPREYMKWYRKRK